MNTNITYTQIPQYPNYAISRCGVVINLVTQKEIAPFFENGRYYRVNVFLTGSKKNHREPIHRLLAMTYMGYEPSGPKLCVDHINNISTDNRLENLQIITSRLNGTKDRVRKYDLPTGVYIKGPKYCACITQTINGVRQREYLGSYHTVNEASNAYHTRRQEIEINI